MESRRKVQHLMLMIADLCKRNIFAFYSKKKNEGEKGRRERKAYQVDLPQILLLESSLFQWNSNDSFGGGWRRPIFDLNVKCKNKNTLFTPLVFLWTGKHTFMVPNPPKVLKVDTYISSSGLHFFCVPKFVRSKITFNV